MKIAYLLGGFPVLSQTFVLNEITGLIDQGRDVSIFSIGRPDKGKVHQKVRDYGLMDKTFYLYDREEKSRLEIFEEGTKKLFEGDIDKNLEILKRCYEKEKSRENTFRRFIRLMNFISEEGIIEDDLRFIRLYNLIKDKKIDHIHCHFAKKNVEFAYRLNQMLGIPYTFTTHAFDIFFDVDKDIKKWADNAKKVIAVSEFNKKYMNEKLGIPLEKIEIVTYSKYLNKLIPIEKYYIEPFKIISISRLVEKKGYPYLIEACKILKDKGINFKCEIQGDGPMREELDKLIKELGLESNVELGSSLTHEEVLEFMESGSVFVLPCVQASNGDMDGIPNVLMEAMAKEIPTISTKLVGIPELIEDGVNGLLVSPNNAQELAEAIIKIKNDKNFADKIRKKGREKVMDKFNVRKNVRKLVEVF